MQRFYDRLIRIEDLNQPVLKGYSNLFEITESLEVTEEYLLDTITSFKKSYGTIHMILCHNFMLSPVPTFELTPETIIKSKIPTDLLNLAKNLMVFLAFLMVSTKTALQQQSYISPAHFVRTSYLKSHLPNQGSAMKQLQHIFIL
ncbi:hypothetical protein [Anaerotignum sp.]|uniref:hypothetical protein n=1 Tax=Anaerotignum sp. TaxID=2039241 RepID=UPI002714E82D|nr:hypothetical protein [Anaerotignum sp.]